MRAPMVKYMGYFYPKSLYVSEESNYRQTAAETPRDNGSVYAAVASQRPGGSPLQPGPLRLGLLNYLGNPALT